MSIIRHSDNPILTRADVPFKVNSIFNTGAVKMGSQYLLLCRVELPSGRSALVKAVSEDGVRFKVDDRPCLNPENHGEYLQYTEWGIEDPRITQIGDRYYILYTGYSKHMPLVMMASTADFNSFELHGPITEATNKDAALFPEKIGGYYWKVDRPVKENGHGDIWISRSPDLLHWGNYRFLYSGRDGSWEKSKVGGSTPPVRTDKGWLMLYHGVRTFEPGPIYRLGVMLLDLEQPWKITGHYPDPILSPEMDYERSGDVNNVVFTCGWVVEADGKINIYYSGADTNICLATSTVDQLLKLCL